MPQIGDVARSRDIENLSALLGDIPDISTEESVNQAAELVYQCVYRQINKAKSPSRVRAGQKGYIWLGNIRRDVFYTLWPTLNQTPLVDKERASELIGAILGKLNRDKSLQCVNTGSYGPSAWWINDNYLPSTTRKITDDDDAEGTADQQETSVKIYPCRVCSETFNVNAGRIVHEMKTHKIAVGEDGTVHHFDESFSDEYVKDMIITVLREAGESLTMRGVEQAAVAKDPRMRNTAVAMGLRMLLDEERVEDRQVGMRTRYEIRSKPVEPTTAVEATTSPEDEPIKVTSVAPVVNSLTASVVALRGLLSTARSALTSADHTVAAVIERAEWLEKQLAKTQQELAALKMRSTAASGGASSARVKELEEELEHVRVERDKYKSEWEIFQKAIRGVLKN